MTAGLGRSLVITLALLSLFCAGAASGTEHGGEESDFADLMAFYDHGEGNFTTLEPGDSFIFIDTVEYSAFNSTMGATEVWFESTGSSIYSKRLPLLGEPSDIKKGARVRFNVTIIEHPSTGREWFSCDLDQAKVLEEAPEGLTEGNSIKVFGFRIGLDFLPGSLQVPLIRSIVVFSAWMVITIALWYTTLGIIKLADRTQIRLNTKIIKILRVPFFTIVLLYGLLLSIALLEPPHELMSTLYSFYEIAVIILMAVILVKFFKNVLFVYLAHIAQRTENKADDILIPVANKVIAVVIWVAAGVMVMGKIGIDVSFFIAGLGIAGLVIAFAAQDTLSNFFSGLILLVDRPFKEGDWIQLDEKEIYQVREIGLRSTRLFNAFSNEIVTIPNNRISEHMFSNLSEPDLRGRKTIKVGVGYNSDPRKVGQILVDEVNAHPEVLVDPHHSTIYRFTDYGDSALQFSVTFWLNDFNEQWRVASELRERIYYRFSKEGIVIPYPQRVVHMVKDAKS
jgi:small-conductance mechanosensitive channel